MHDRSIIKPHEHLVSVAPMMDFTDRHARYFLRVIAKSVRLYTEMITAQAILHGDRQKLLEFHTMEHPITLQLGGSDPKALADASMIGEDFGYDDINLNVGCPSNRVQKGQFGACLMLNPQLVAECVAAIKAKVNCPVTVKCRIGVDDQDSFEAFEHFIKTVAAAGCKLFIVHARKAWLSGLSPKENREIPPLNYEYVYRIKQHFPHLRIIINGGIKTVDEVASHLNHVDGVMIGRQAYHQPYLLAELQQSLFQEQAKARDEIIEAIIPYVHDQLHRGMKLQSMTKHILGLYHGQMGGAHWRRALSGKIPENAGIEFMQAAQAKVIEVQKRASC